MRKNVFCLVLAIMAVCAFTVSVGAGEKATKDECVAKTKEAAKLFQEAGVEEALNEINDKTGPFVWKDTYVFALNLDSTKIAAHPIKPGLIGKNLMALKDVNGKMFFAEFVNTAKNGGEGWVSYMWPKPGEKKPSPKVTYVYRVPGANMVMLAGVYEE